jgi:branched-chain amino acid transport system substrate-binding protein
VQIAVDEGYKSVATILIDVPAAVGPIKALSDPAYEKFGIKNTFAVVPPGTPDMTPQIQAALAEDPEMFTIVGDVNFCTAGLNALSTLGFTGTKFINYQCFSPDLATSVAGGIDGVKVGATQSLDPKDSEVELYDAVMTKYAPDTEPFGATTSGGYSIVLAAARALSTTTGDLTPDVVKNAFATVGPQPMPLMSGQTFQCDRSLYVLTPSVCSTGLVIVTLDGDGIATESVQVDTKKIFPDA